MTDTATVYRRVAGARPTRDAEPPIRHVAVVGGGTAGWMTALLLAHSGYGRRLQVTVLESPQVGIIGVGEGSTPWLRGFFEELGIEEAEWMPACHATYKSGIRFDGWSTRPDRGTARRGLGLALVHRLVQRHGGTVDVSEGPGAVFTVVLPVPGVQDTPGEAGALAGARAGSGADG